MKKYLSLLSVIGLLALIGCTPIAPTPIAPTLIAPTLIAMPNLVIQTARFDRTTSTVSIKETNNGGADAGAHLTYIEINLVGVSDVSKPQCQYSLDVSSIAAGSIWSSDPIPFTEFSCPAARGSLDPSSLLPETANLVVIADAKNMVKEINESDNISDTNQ